MEFLTSQPVINMLPKNTLQSVAEKVSPRMFSESWCASLDVITTSVAARSKWWQTHVLLLCNSPPWHGSSQSVTIPQTCTSTVCLSECINVKAMKKFGKFALYMCSDIWNPGWKNDQLILVDVILSNGLIDIWFIPFPSTAVSSKKYVGFLPPSSPWNRLSGWVILFTG